MPREVLDIRNFHTGLITNADDRDIPVDAGADGTQNLDPNVNGKLAGAKNIATKHATYGKKSKLFGWIERTDGKRDLVGVADTDIKIVTDFYGSIGETTNTANGSCVEVNNQEAHIGCGNANADIPKWVGYLTSGQFNQATPTALQIVDSTVGRGSYYPSMDKIIVGNTGAYYYGYSERTERLYRINNSTHVIDLISEPIEAIKSISQTGGDIWVLCGTGQTDYWLYRLNSSFVISFKVLLTITLPLGAELSDIHAEASSLWYSAYHASGFSVASGRTSFLWSSTVPSVTGIVTPTNRSFSLVGIGLSGRFSADFVAVPFKKGLVTMGVASSVGLAYQIVGGQAFYYNAGLSAVTISKGIFQVNTSYTAGTAQDGTNSDMDSWDDVTTRSTNKCFVAQQFTGGAERFYFSLNATTGLTVYPYSISKPTSGHVSNDSAVRMAVYTSYTFGGIPTGTIASFEYSNPNHTISVFSSEGSGLYATNLFYTVGATWDTKTIYIIPDIDISASVGSVDSNIFDVTRYYFWAFSVVYDGYQESVLSDWVDDGLTLSANDRIITINFRNLNGSNLPPNSRITAIKIYRASSSVDSQPETLFRLVQELFLEKNLTTMTVDGLGNVRSVVNYERNLEGASYESHVGFSEALDTLAVHYSISCQVSNYHIVGNANVYSNIVTATKLLPDGTHMLFRSKPFRFDTFDWTVDYLRLPFIPKALAAYNGRVYAFDNNKMLRINPEGFYIEDIYDGVGCDSKQGFVVTEFGLFFANRYGCYWYDGQSVQKISTVIQDKWQALSATNTIMVTYDSVTGQVLFFDAYPSGNEIVICYAYHLENKRWDYYAHPSAIQTDGTTGVFSGKDGESYIVTVGTIDSAIYRYFSTGNRSWAWVSRDLDMDSASIPKKFYKIEVKGTYDNAYYNTASATPATNITALNKDKAEQIKLKVVGDTEQADSVSIEYRRMHKS